MRHDIAITVDQEIFGLKAQFEAVCTDKSIAFNKEAEFAIQIITGNDYLLSVANNNRQSLRDAVTNVAAIGVSLNPAKKQAYLVPRKGKICLDISYLGMVDMATNSGSIKWVQSQVVYANDTFELNGLGVPPTHKCNPFSKERGDMVGVYVVAKTADGECLTHTMTIEAVYAIRNRSEAWKGGKTNPWKTDEVEMIKKTCIKQASKLWPKVERLQAAIHYLNTDGGEGIDFDAQPVTVNAETGRVEGFDLSAALDAIEACTNAQEWNEAWQTHGKLATVAKDKQGWLSLNAAAKAKKAKLLAQQEGVAA